jgi:hypothetical protein
MFSIRIPILDGWLRSCARRRSDRRTHPRFKALSRDARVLWKDGQPCHVAIAELADISRGGAKVLTKRPIGKEIPAHLGLVSDGDTSWVEASVVQATQGPDGRWTVQLQFDELCSDEILAHALNTPVSEVQRRT